MKAIAVDTSVLLCILKGEPEAPAWLQLLNDLTARTALIISSVVLGEVRSYFDTDKACLETLAELLIAHSPFSEEASLLAGRIYDSYRQSGGARTTILPDFLVAAHASTQASAFVALDRGYLRTYFPRLELLIPR